MYSPLLAPKTTPSFEYFDDAPQELCAPGAVRGTQKRLKDVNKVKCSVQPQNRFRILRSVIESGLRLVFWAERYDGECSGEPT